MKFDNYTIAKLKRILEDLDFECSGYLWGTEEHEFLMELCGQIEDALRGGRRMKYSELEKIAKIHGWTKIQDDDFWLSYTKNDTNIDIKKYQIDNNIFLWFVESDNAEINLNNEIDFINACIELGKTPPADREDEKRFIIPLPELVTTDGRQQYLTHKDCKFFASRRDEGLRQTWKEEHLKHIPEIYRQFAVEFDEDKEY